MTSRAVAPYLSSFLNYEKNLKSLSIRNLNLKRVESVLEKIGSPHKSLKVIHIAGSKGKGSTAAFTAHILKEAGYKVGLYTSPHLYRLNERLRILRIGTRIEEISDRKFADALAKIKPAIEEYRRHSSLGHLTYFEVLTILAFYYFKKEKVDFAVLETGLGGRLDATNVCHSLVCAITPISLEHTQQLGRTLSKISFEKSAIIKNVNGLVPVAVIAPQKKEALTVIRKRIRDMGGDAIFIEKKSVRLLSVHASGQKFKMGPDVFSSRLLGPHQMINVATAVGIIAALQKFGYKISSGAIKQGIAETVWPLRFEMIRTKPWIILDAAHNRESCERLKETVEQIFPGQKVSLIFGSSDDKDIQGMAQVLMPMSRRIILTSADHPRAWRWSPRDAKKFFKAREIEITDSVRSACQLALDQCWSDAIIVITGSIFVAAEAHKIVKKL